MTTWSRCRWNYLSGFVGEKKLHNFALFQSISLFPIYFPFMPYCIYIYIYILVYCIYIYIFFFPEKTSDLGWGFQMKRLWRFTATWGRLPVPMCLRLNSFQMGWNHLVTWTMMMVLLPKHVFRFLAGAIGIPLMSAMFSHDFGVPHSCKLGIVLKCVVGIKKPMKFWPLNKSCEWYHSILRVIQIMQSPRKKFPTYSQVIKYLQN